MHLIKEKLEISDAPVVIVGIRADRHKLAKRLWRGTADDGEEFGFELSKPLRDGDVVLQTEKSRYVIRQEPEAVLEIDLTLPPSAAAGVGWAIGNLHLELMSESNRLLTPDDSAARQLLARIQIPYRSTVAVFRPGRFARGDLPAGVSSGAQELGTSHKH